MSEDAEHRRKRLKIRSWRRGIKEMDLILGRFWDAHGASLDPETLDLYEALLDENDQDIYQWMSGQKAPPPAHAPLVQQIQSKIEPL